MQSSTKIVLGIAALAAVVGAVTFANRVRSSGGGLVSDVEVVERPVHVRVVQPKDLIETLVHTGTLQANRDVVLSAEVAGKVVTIHKDLGDGCGRGAPLVQLDATTYQIAVMQGKAALAQANTAFEQARRDLTRTETLHDRRAVTAYELERAQSGERTSAAVVEQASAALSMAQRNLQQTAIRCPFEGVVAQRMVEVGQLVGPQTPLVRLVDVAALRLTISVGAAELARLKLGQRVELADPSMPETTYEGEVSRLGVAADPVTRTFPVEVSVPGGESGPKPGQVVRAVIDLALHERVLAVPEHAVVTTDAGRVVFVVVDSAAVRRSVELGPFVDGEVIVRAGLEAGAAIVTEGQANLRDGDRVVVTAEPASPIASASAADPPPAPATRSSPSATADPAGSATAP